MMPEQDRKQGKGRKWLLGFAILLAAVLLYFALKDISWGEVWQTIRSAQPALLLVGIGLTIFNLLMRGLRWGVLLSAEKRIPPATMFWATAVGYLGNLALPARAGEVIRSAALSRKTGLSIGYIFATALTERVLDVLILVIIALISAPAIGTLPGWMSQALPLMSILGAAAVLFLVLAPKFENLLGKVIHRLPLPEKWKSGLAGFLNRFLTGGKAFQHPLRAGGFLGFSVVIWLVDGITAVIVGRALSLHFTLAQVMLFLVGLGLSSAVPSTPGYVGVYQFVAVSILPLFGVTRSQALSFVLVLQAVSVVVVVISGVVGLWRLGIRKLSVQQDGGDL